MSEDYQGHYTIIGVQHRKYQCPNCATKKIHCVAGYENEGGPIELLKDRCGKGCECKCKTQFLGKDGMLHKYGTPDVKPESFLDDTQRNSSDDSIDVINKQFRLKL